MELITLGSAHSADDREQTTSAATIDIDNPPVDPPDGCVNVRLWLLARRKFEEHRLSPSGACPTCPRWKSCPGTRLAKLGLATAMGETNAESEYWIAFAQITPPDAQVRP